MMISGHAVRRWLCSASLILIALPWDSWWWAFVLVLVSVLIAAANRDSDLEIERALLQCLILLTALSVFTSISYGWTRLQEHVQTVMFNGAVVVSCGTIVSPAIIVFLLILRLRGKSGLLWSAIALNIVLAFSIWLIFQGAALLASLPHKTIGEILVSYWVLVVVLNGILFHASTAHQARSVSSIRWTFAMITILMMFTLVEHTRSFSTETKSSSQPRVGIFRPHALDTGNYFGTSDEGHTLSGIGLYGDMLHWLQRSGFDATYLATIDTTAQIDALYIPVLLRPLRNDELLALMWLLRHRVGLVLVGEHSNLEHCEEYTQPILEPLGIRLRFDTTEGLLGEGLRGCQTSSTTAIGHSLARTPWLTYNRGASLEITDRNVRSILWGEFWLADFGDSLAPDRGYLSDYRLSNRDRIGNLTFMCLRDDAQGWIFVAGDSSPFLNQNLAYNASFLNVLFMSATKRDQQTERVYPILVLIVAAGVLLAYIGWKRFSATGQFIVSLLFIGALHFEIIDGSPNMLVTDTTPAPRAIISTAENNRFERDPFADDALTGLTVQLSRLGYIVELTDWAKTKFRPECLFIVNPTISPSHRQLIEINKMAEAGSRIVISGSGQSSAFETYAKALHIRISTQAIGSCKGQGFRTYSAWAIEGLPDGAQPIIADSVVVGAEITRGAGSITILADDGFFLNKNLEGEYSYDPDNLSFVSKLVRRDQDAFRQL